ncbi:MAG: transposase [Candidatus Gracilibacteria bacterium]|nr:transposase [Candidatus Gracilibacteria bacterium]
MIQKKNKYYSFYKNGLKNPSVLATSAEISDIYDNMIKKNGEKSFEEKLEENKEKISVQSFEDNVFYAFVELYKKRWTIEECFKELKSYLSFEKFQVQSHDAIMKYLHIILLVHTLTYIMLFGLTQSHNNFIFVYDFLKEKRNIKNKSNGVKK